MKQKGILKRHTLILKLGGRWQDSQEGGITAEHEDMLWGDGYVYHLDCDDSFTGI